MLILFLPVFYHFPFSLRSRALLHFPSNIHVKRTNGGALAVIYVPCCISAVFIAVSSRSSAPQINGSCAISRIVTVLFSHFRSIRRTTRRFPRRVPVCLQRDFVRYKEALSTRSPVPPSGPYKRTRDKPRQMLRLSS